MGLASFNRMRREQAKKIEKPKLELDGLKNKELKAMCDEKGIEYPANTTKAELIELLGGD